MASDATKTTIKEDVNFLELFAGVVGHHWPSLAASLSLSKMEIKEVKEEGEGLPDSDHALLMLKKWVSSEDATYSKLCQILKTVSLF